MGKKDRMDVEVNLALKGNKGGFGWRLVLSQVVGEFSVEAC